MSIERKHSGARMSQIVTHNKTVYLAGQVALNAPGQSTADQTSDILKSIDDLLSQASSSKSKLLSVVIYLADMATFEEMNAVWDQWVDADNAPARACVESKLAAPQFGVEICVIAAQ